MTPKKPAPSKAVARTRLKVPSTRVDKAPSKDLAVRAADPMGTTYGAGSSDLTITVTHTNPDFTGMITVLGTVALPFTAGTATVTVPASSLGAIEDLGFEVTIGTPGPAPAYDANLDTLVSPIVSNVGSSTHAALGAAYEPHGQSFHVVPGATADDAARIYPTIPVALAALTASGDVGVIDLGSDRSHTLVAGITLDATKHELRGGPRCVIDCSTMTTGTAITVVGNPASVGGRSARAVLADVELVGPGAGSSVDAILFADATSGHGVYHLGPTRVDVSNFRHGYCYGDNAWAITLWNCTAHANTVDIWFPSNGSAAGERITFVSCTFHDTTQVASGGHGGGAFFFVDCSMTYPTSKMITLTGGHKAFLSNCHIETSDSGTDTLFDVSHSASYLRVDGGIFMIEGSTPLANRLRPSHVTVTDGNILFDDVFMQGVGLASGVFGTTTGTGVCEVRGTRTSLTEANPAKLTAPSSSGSLLVDGGMEQATVWDAWAIVNDTAAITSRLTGTNVSVATSTDTARTGTRSLKASVVSQAATTRFGLFVPARQGRPMSWQMWLAIPGAQIGSVNFQGVWVAANAISSYGVLLFNTISSENNVTVTKSTAAALPWTVWDSGSRLRYPPPAATHLLLRVDVSAMAAGPVYVDDASVYYW